MLTKIESKVVRQPDARVRRALYQSDSAEVLLQHDADTGAFLSFEIDADGPGGRRWTVTWCRGAGLRTGAVDTGETEPLHYKAAPMVIWDFTMRSDRIEAARRLIVASSIEEGLRDSVLRRLDA